MPDDDGPASDGPAPGPDSPGGADAAAVPDEPTSTKDPTTAEPVVDSGDASSGVDEETPDPVSEDVVACRLAGVEAALTALTRRHDEDSERAGARERVIERQHADIERLRTDERFGLLQPMLVDLCALRNDLLRQAAKMPADQTVERMVELLRSFADSVEDTLLRCGVEAQPREIGAPFAPRQQRVARVVETDDPERDGTVAEIVQDGYAEIDGGRVVVPTRVAVHRAVPARAPEQDTNATKEHVDA